MFRVKIGVSVTTYRTSRYAASTGLRIILDDLLSALGAVADRHVRRANRDVEFDIQSTAGASFREFTHRSPPGTATPGLLNERQGARAEFREEHCPAVDSLGVVRIPNSRDRRRGSTFP